MKDFGWSRRLWGSLLPASACLASGAALGQVPVTKFITVQPFDMCSGAICAPFNTTSQIGKPTTQNSTTNPIGFVYSYTDPTTNTKVYIDITRALLNQIGVDVIWKPIKQYATSTFQTLNVVTNNSACGISGNGSPATGLQSCDFLTVSQQPCISTLPAPTPTCVKSPLATPTSVINMFFVNKLNPPPGQTGSQLYGFSWVNNNGVSIGANTFFPPAPLTPRVGVLAHELGHNLGLDHTIFGAGPYNPIAIDPDGGALEGTPANTMVGECDANYPACMANLMTAGNLRTEPTVNCAVVSNPPLPGQTPCASTAPSLANGNADQLTTIDDQWAGLPVSQQEEVVDPSGFIQSIPNSTTTLSVPKNSNSMTVSVTGAANGGPQETLLAWVLMLPPGLQFNSQFHIISQSRKNLVEDADFPHPDAVDNTVNGVYNLGTLYDLCSASTAQCLIVEFNLPGAGTGQKGTDQVTFSKGFKTSLTNADLCGAKITSVFSHGYMTTSQLSCPSNGGPLTASSWSPDPTAPVLPQIVNDAAFNTAASGNPPCTLDSVTGLCPDPTVTGIQDADPSQEPQVPICYSGGVPVTCP